MKVYYSDNLLSWLCLGMGAASVESDPGLWLVESDHMNCILTSDWAIVFDVGSTSLSYSRQIRLWLIVNSKYIYFSLISTAFLIVDY